MDKAHFRTRLDAIRPASFGVSASNDEGTFPDKIHARGARTNPGAPARPARATARDHATKRTGACELLRGSPRRIQRGEVSVRSKPLHARTGRRGYLGKCGSV